MEVGISDFSALERDGWADSATAASYAEGFAGAARQCVAAMVEAVGTVPGIDALDLCCGHGIVARGLADSGATVTGVDFSPAMLAMAREAVPEGDFVEADAAALPFEDASFDVVTAGFGIPHLPDPEHCFTEVRRVLRPGGRFAFSVWQAPPASQAFGFLFAAVAEHGHESVTLPPGPGAHDYADLDTAGPALMAAGFEAPRLDTVDSYWLIDDPATPYDFMYEGTVRGAALLRPQPEDNKAAIREAMCRMVRSHCGDRAPWRVAIPAAIVSARVPA